MSNKREAFCRYIVNGCNPTEAYIKSFNVTSERKHTATEAGSRLMKLATIQQHIETLQASIDDKLASEVVWTKARFINEAEANLLQSRDLGQMNPANTSLQLIGRVTGILEDKPQNQVNIGIIDTMGKLPDALLEQLAAMASEPVPIDDTGAIEASFQLLDTEPEEPRKQGT